MRYRLVIRAAVAVLLIGPVGALASDAYHRLLNPVVVLGARDFKSEEK